MGLAATSTMPRSRWSIRTGAWSPSPIGMRRAKRNTTCSADRCSDHVAPPASRVGRGAVGGACAAAGKARAGSHHGPADAGPDSAACAGRMVAGAVADAPHRRHLFDMESQRYQRNPVGVPGGRRLDAAACTGCSAGNVLGGAGEIHERAIAGRYAAGDQLAAGRIRGPRCLAGRSHRDGIPAGLALHGFARAVVQQLSVGRSAADRQGHAGDRRGGLPVAGMEARVGTQQDRTCAIGGCAACVPTAVSPGGVSYAIGNMAGALLVCWLQKLTTPKIRTEGTAGRGKVPEGVWEKCSGCGIGLYRPELERNLMVCPKCGHHHPIGARARLAAFLDEGGNELDAGLGPVDALKFKDSKKYRDRILAAQKATGEKDALVSIEGSVKGMPVVACAFEFAYMGGSMGSVVGEKITRAAEAALRGKTSFVCFTATGGARMQEGLQSLMQMAKTS